MTLFHVSCEPIQLQETVVYFRGLKVDSFRVLRFAVRLSQNFKSYLSQRERRPEGPRCEMPCSIDVCFELFHQCILEIITSPCQQPTLPSVRALCDEVMCPQALLEKATDFVHAPRPINKAWLVQLISFKR